MVIDMRLRPPYKGIKNMSFFKNPHFLNGMVKKNGTEMPPSCFENSMELLIQEMDEAGVDMGVVPVRTADGVTNDDLVALVEEYPNRFIGMAGVDPTDGIPESLEVINKYVVNGPCKGIVMELPFCKKGPLHVNDPMLTPIYEKCAAEHIPVYLQWGGMFAPNLAFYEPREMEEVAVKYPMINFICAHAGYPYAAEMCAIALMRPNIYLAPDAYITEPIPGHEPYVTAARTTLKDKICFSTAYPLSTIADIKKKYEEYNFEAAEDIFCNNAKRALGLE